MIYIELGFIAVLVPFALFIQPRRHRLSDDVTTFFRSRKSTFSFPRISTIPIFAALKLVAVLTALGAGVTLLIALGMYVSSSPRTVQLKLSTVEGQRHKISSIPETTSTTIPKVTSASSTANTTMQEESKWRGQGYYALANIIELPNFLTTALFWQNNIPLNDSFLMTQICYMESGFHQMGEGAKAPLRNTAHHIGICQIDEDKWLPKSQQLGYNMATLDGNLKMAFVIYKDHGADEWATATRARAILASAPLNSVTSIPPTVRSLPAPSTKGISPYIWKGDIPKQGWTSSPRLSNLSSLETTGPITIFDGVNMYALSAGDKTDKFRLGALAFLIHSRTDEPGLESNKPPHVTIIRW